MLEQLTVSQSVGHLIRTQLLCCIFASLSLWLLVHAHSIISNRAECARTG